jgi:hypothetical protein
MNQILIMSAFDSWKKDQLDEKYIGAVYSMLAEKGKVLPKFPIEYLRKPLPAETLKVRNLKKSLIQSANQSKFLVSHAPDRFNIRLKRILVPLLFYRFFTHIITHFTTFALHHKD